MAEVTKLTLAVDSTQVRRASTDLGNLSRAGDKAEKSVGGMAGAFKKAGAAAGALAGSIVAREIIQAADAYSLLNSRLLLVTKNTKEFERAQTEVLSIAQRTRAGLQETGNLYASLARSTQSLGVSQEDVLGVTESINQALIISGGSAQSAAAALVQLGQGFASGTLRGEELNSVLEQAPRLAQAIADGLGVPLGQLRELGKDGALTAEKVFGALQKSAAQLSAEFSRMPLTVGQATTQAANAISVLIGTMDEATGTTQGLAGVISGLSELVRELAGEIQKAGRGSEDVGFLASAFITVAQAVRILWSDVVFVFKGIGREIGGIAAQLAALARLDFKAFTAISDAMREDAERARRELDKFQQQVLNPFLRSQGRGTTGFQDPRLIGTTPANETVGFRPAGGGGGGGGGGGRPPRAPKEQLSEAEQYLQNLRRQLEATADLSVEEALLRDIQLGRLGKVTPEQERQALALARQLDQFKVIKDEEKKQAEEAKRVEEEAQRTREEGKRLFEETRTPVEQLAAELANLDKLLAKEAITWDTYSRAVFNAQDKFEKATQKTAEQADDVTKNLGQNIQRALGEELTNVLEGDFDNIGKAFTRMLNRMVAEAIAADIARALGFGKEGSISGGGGIFPGIISFFGSMFGAPGRANGGPVAAGSMYEVNERGTPELLNVAGKQFLMMGNQSGHVTPMAAGSGGQSIVFNNYQSFAPGTDSKTMLQGAKDARRMLERAGRIM